MRSKLITLVTAIALAQTAFAQDKLTSQRPTVQSKPIPLDWRSVKWPSIDYSRTPIEGGAALYTLPSASARRFRVQIVLPVGIYNTPQPLRPALGAAVDLVLQGGAGKMSFDALQNAMLEQGLNAWTDLQGTYFTIGIEGLSGDFSKALSFLRDITLHPRFDKEALTYWKQQKIDEFQSIMDASSMSKQYQFIIQESIRLMLGNDHYFATNLKRRSQKTIEAISYDDVKSIYARALNRAGALVMLSGTYSKKDEAAVASLIKSFPRHEPLVTTWLPGRGTVPATSKIRVAFIQKSDMPQATIRFSYLYPNVGTLNDLEKVDIRIPEEVYSASAGVVGTDRFSKAMRADTGISYSPHANFEDNYVEPNTNVAFWTMDFTAQRERIGEGIQVAKKTWEHFCKEGINADELERARTSKMNALLAQEETTFDKANFLLRRLLENKIPEDMPIETELTRLEKVTDLGEVNAVLKQVVNSAAVPALVVMGNTSEDVIATTKNDPAFDVVKIEQFADLVKELQ